MLFLVLILQKSAVHVEQCLISVNTIHALIVPPCLEHDLMDLVISFPS